MYMTEQEKTKKMAKHRETNALSANICTHAQIKTSTEQKQKKNRNENCLAKNQRHVYHHSSFHCTPLYPQTPFVLWQRGNCLHKKVSATLYVFDILNGPVATCQSLFKFAFHIFPTFL